MNSRRACICTFYWIFISSYPFVRSITTITNIIINTTAGDWYVATSACLMSEKYFHCMNYTFDFWLWLMNNMYLTLSDNYSRKDHLSKHLFRAHRYHLLYNHSSYHLVVRLGLICRCWCKRMHSVQPDCKCHSLSIVYP